MTLGTLALNSGNYGLFPIVGSAGFISAAVGIVGVLGYQVQGLGVCRGDTVPSHFQDSKHGPPPPNH